MPILFFIFYPFAEVMAWWWFISTFSFLDAVIWCFASAAVGIWVLRLQGGAAFAEMQSSAKNGSLPSGQVVHRILMSFGAMLLILPGLIAKCVGALLILPGVRHLVVWLLLFLFSRKLMQGFARFGRAGSMGGFVFTQGMKRDVHPADPDVLDVKAEVLENKKSSDS